MYISLTDIQLILQPTKMVVPLYYTDNHYTNTAGMRKSHDESKFSTSVSTSWSKL